MPDPGSAEDVVELSVTRLPAEIVDRLIGARHENGGIAGTAGVDFSRDGMTGYAACGLDHFANAEALPITKVVDERSEVRGFGR